MAEKVASGPTHGAAEKVDVVPNYAAVMRDG